MSICMPRHVRTFEGGVFFFLVHGNIGILYFGKPGKQHAEVKK